MSDSQILQEEDFYEVEKILDKVIIPSLREKSMVSSSIRSSGEAGINLKIWPGNLSKTSITSWTWSMNSKGTMNPSQR